MPRIGTAIREVYHHREYVTALAAKVRAGA
jgi:hypothetical protein